MEGPERPSHRLTVALRPDLEEDRRGMIPRALEQVFQSSLGLKEQGWEVSDAVSLWPVCLLDGQA